MNGSYSIDSTCIDSCQVSMKTLLEQRGRIGHIRIILI